MLWAVMQRAQIEGGDFMHFVGSATAAPSTNPRTAWMRRRALLVELLAARCAGATVLMSTHDHAFAAALQAEVIEFESLREPPISKLGADLHSEQK